DSPEELVRLLAGLGFEKAALSIQERLGAPELKEQVTQTVADQLVIHPDRSGTASPELVQEARLGRRALEALQGGAEGGAVGRGGGGGGCSAPCGGAGRGASGSSSSAAWRRSSVATTARPGPTGTASNRVGRRPRSRGVCAGWPTRRPEPRAGASKRRRSWP